MIHLATIRKFRSRNQRSSRWRLASALTSIHQQLESESLGHLSKLVRAIRSEQMDSKLLAQAIQIRPFRTEDSLELYYAARESSAAICATMTWLRPDYSLKDAARFVGRSSNEWYSGQRYDFAIVDAMDGNFCGSVGLSQIDRRHRFANVGFWVRRSRLGQGIATNAVRLIADFGLGELQLLRLEFLVARSNLASQRVVNKVGAKLEGTLRSRLMLPGGQEDAFMYSLIRQE